MKILDLGRIEYSKAYRIQKETLERRKKNEIPDTLIVAEHPHVFTIGRTGSYENLLVDSDSLRRKKIKIHEIDRGGDITYHGPGQIVLYPIVNIKELSMDLRLYIRKLEEFVIGFLAELGVESERIAGKSGVWTGNKKIAFLGIGVSKWVAFHGISVNINVNLSYFSMIRSCGIKGIEITSLAKILNKEINMNDARKGLIQNFEKSFRPQETRAKIPALA